MTNEEKEQYRKEYEEGKHFLSLEDFEKAEAKKKRLADKHRMTIAKKAVRETLTGYAETLSEMENLKRENESLKRENGEVLSLQAEIESLKNELLDLKGEHAFYKEQAETLTKTNEKLKKACKILKSRLEAGNKPEKAENKPEKVESGNKDYVELEREKTPGEKDVINTAMREKAERERFLRFMKDPRRAILAEKFGWKT